MKNAILFTLIIISFISCVKPNAPIVYTPEFWNWSDSIYGMKAEVNGDDYTCDSASVIYSEVSGWKSVIGTNSDNINLSVTSKDFSVGSVYPLKAGSTNSSAAYATPGGIVFSTAIGTTGECKILENDSKHIKGLFYFETTSVITGSSVKITKGYFNAAK